MEFMVVKASLRDDRIRGVEKWGEARDRISADAIAAGMMRPDAIHTLLFCGHTVWGKNFSYERIRLNLEYHL